MFELPIASGFYTHEILPLACQTCVNWIPIVTEKGALSQSALLDRQGLVQFAELSGEFRGDVVFDSEYYTLNGTTLSKITSLGVVSTIGTIAGSGRVSIAYNEDYIVFVTQSGSGYYSDGATVTLIVDADFLPASTVCFVDGYFVFSALDGSRFFCSATNDPSSYSSLDRSTAEERPDAIVAVFVSGNLLHVAGTQTIERHNNIGGVSFPFQRINQGTSMVGVYGRYTPIDAAGAYVFLGGSVNEGAQIYALAGGQPQVISTTAIDTVLQAFSDAELALAYTMYWQQNGQSIFAITIESDTITSRTFAYNFSSQEWFELSSGESAFRAKSVTRIYNKYLAGDDSNQVGYFSNTHTDYGDTIFREKASQPFISNAGAAFRIGRLMLWCQAGSGDGTTNPQVMMDYSDDLGRTWSTPEWVGIGEVGEYGMFSEWRRQGYVPRNRVYRFKATDAFQFNIMKLTAA